MSFPRYPAYKNTAIKWLKQIPEHWSTCRLKNFLSIENGADHKEVLSEDGFPVFGSGGPFANANSYLYDGETILLGRKGTIDCPLYYKGKFWAVDTMYWSRVSPDCTGKYVFYSCLTIPFAYYQTSTAIPSMTKISLGGHFICMPPANEQKQIADFLDRETTKIDALIAEQERLIELLQEKRQAVISHAVTKGLNPDAPMKEAGVEWLGEVPEHWEVKALKRLSPKQTVGIVVNPSSYISDEGLPFIYGGDIREEVIDLENCRKISNEDSLSQSKTILEGGDLITVRVGAPGVTAVVPEAAAGGNCASVMLTKKGAFESRWLCYLMNSRPYRHQVEVVQYGAAQEQFNISHAVEFICPTPPIVEQKEIADYLLKECQVIDQLGEQVKMSIVLMQERRSALISAAVTGQIDVRGLATEKATT